MAVVLIVEDDLFILEMARIQIEEFGHVTLRASDVNGASAILRSKQPIDVLFTDINLKSSVLGGCELGSLAIRLRPQIGVIYGTGNIITDAMKATFVDGAVLLRKPYTQDQLQSALARLLLAPV